MIAPLLSRRLAAAMLVAGGASLAAQSSHINIPFERYELPNGLTGILAVSDEPLVSCDYNGDKHSSTVDSELTTVIGDTVKVMSWYDNEMGYSQRLYDLARYVAERL